MSGCFIGIDLSWKCEPFKERGTSVCVCDKNGRASVPELVTSDDEIIGVVSRHDDPWVAIDASLRVPNLKGLRVPEKMLVSEGIHVLPTNKEFLSKHCGGSRGEMLAGRLEERGFRRAGTGSNGKRLFFETYPYGILRCITERGISYKKESADVKRKGCLEVFGALKQWIPELEPSKQFVSMVEGGRWNPSVPDMIDSLLCVGCLYAHWLYDGKRTRLVGDETDGYILLPKRC